MGTSNPSDRPVPVQFKSRGLNKGWMDRSIHSSPAASRKLEPHPFERDEMCRDFAGPWASPAPSAACTPRAPLAPIGFNKLLEKHFDELCISPRGVLSPSSLSAPSSTRSSQGTPSPYGAPPPCGGETCLDPDFLNDLKLISSPALSHRRTNSSLTDTLDVAEVETPRAAPGAQDFTQRHLHNRSFEEGLFVYPPTPSSCGTKSALSSHYTTPSHSRRVSHTLSNVTSPRPAGDAPELGRLSRQTSGASMLSHASDDPYYAHTPTLVLPVHMELSRSLVRVVEAEKARHAGEKSDFA